MSAREPLPPDQQALAARLREWSVAEPSAALDQRILAQARSAVARPQRRPRPLLVGLASAATLVLAVGVVWRVLQPPPVELPAAPAALPQMRAAGAQAEGATGATASEPAAAALESARDGSASPPPAPALPQAGGGAGRSADPRRERASPVVPPVPATAPPPEPAPAGRAAPRIEAVPAAPPAPPPPPPPPPAPAQDPARPSVSRRAADAEPGDQGVQAVQPAPERLHERRQAIAGSDAHAEAEVAAAIQQIRALAAAGDVAGARSAIARLRSQAPALVLPADLQALEADPER